MYICDFSRSDGAGSATTRKTRGLTRSVSALIVPPLPAASRPSNTMMMRWPLTLHPILKMAQLRLELAQLLLISLARDLDRGLALGFGDPVLGLLHGALLLVMPLSRVLQLWSRVVEEG